MNIINDDVYGSNMGIKGIDIQFTRYFYIKDDVRASLLMSLLNNSEDAIFWAYELYFSGFEQEFCDLIYKIYYDFYASSNLCYEPYLRRNLTQLCEDNTKTGIVLAVIEDLLMRTFTPDVFICRIIEQSFVTDIHFLNKLEDLTQPENLHNQIVEWTQTKDYRSLASYILTSTNIKCIQNVYATLGLDLVIKDTISKVSINVKILAKIFNSIRPSQKINKLIMSTDENIDKYKTVMPTSHNSLKNACVCDINATGMLGIFALNRHNYTISEIAEMYNHNWLYHATFSPLWAKRVKQFGGYRDFTNKCVKFTNADQEDTFNDTYNYENDEQSINTKMRSLRDIDRYSWIKFYKIFQNKLITPTDELEALDDDKIKY